MCAGEPRLLTSCMNSETYVQFRQAAAHSALEDLAKYGPGDAQRLAEQIVADKRAQQADNQAKKERRYGHLAKAFADAGMELAPLDVFKYIVRMRTFLGATMQCLYKTCEFLFKGTGTCADIVSLWQAKPTTPLLPWETRLLELLQQSIKEEEEEEVEEEEEEEEKGGGGGRKESMERGQHFD